MINHELKRQGLAIEDRLAQRGLWVRVDSVQMEQVLINLLSNAIQATSQGGRVDIQVESTPKGVAIAVIDTGTGIPKENLEKIFEPFFSTKSPGEGTGLGLFVTRGIIEKLGGTIKAESTIGQGTRFCVRLPKDLMEAAESHAASGANLDKLIFHLQDESNQGKKTS